MYHYKPTLNALTTHRGEYLPFSNQLNTKIQVYEEKTTVSFSDMPAQYVDVISVTAGIFPGSCGYR